MNSNSIPLDYDSVVHKEKKFVIYEKMSPKIKKEKKRIYASFLNNHLSMLLKELDMRRKKYSSLMTEVINIAKYL